MIFKSFKITYQLTDREVEKELSAQSFTIGRSPNCELSIKAEVISRNHMLVEYEDGQIFITDLGSTNGTYINGVKIKAHKRAPFQSTDELWVRSKKDCCFSILVETESHAVTEVFDASTAEDTVLSEFNNPKATKENAVVSKTPPSLAGETVYPEPELVDEPLSFENFDDKPVVLPPQVRRQANLSNYKKEKDAKPPSKKIVSPQAPSIPLRKGGYIPMQADAPDNIFENIVYMAKNVRFNKEQEIKRVEQEIRQRLEQAEEEAERLVQEAEAAAEELQSRSKEEYQELIANAQKEFDHLQSEGEALKRHRIDEGHKNYSEKMALIEKERKKVLREAEERHFQLTSQNIDLEKAINSNQDLAAKYEKEAEEFRQEHKKCLEIIEGARAEKNNLMMQLEQLRPEFSTLKKNNEEQLLIFNEQIPELEKRTVDLKSQTEEEESLIEKMSLERVKLESNLEELRLSVVDKQSTHDKLYDKLQKLEEQISFAQKEFDELRIDSERERVEVNKEIADKKLKLQKEAAAVHQKLSDEKRIEEERLSALSKEAEAIRDRAEKEKEKLILEAEEKVTQLRKDGEATIAQADKEKERLILEAEEKVMQLRKAGEDATARAEKEIAVMHEQAQKEAQVIIDKANLIREEVDRQKQGLESQLKARTDEAERYCKELRQSAEELRDRLLQESEAESQMAKRRLEADLKLLEKSAEDQRIKDHRASDEQCQELLKKAELEAKSIVSQASVVKLQAEKKLLEAEKAFEKMQEDAEMYYLQLKEQATKDVEKQRLVMLSEISEERKQSEAEIKEISDKAHLAAKSTVSEASMIKLEAEKKVLEAEKNSKKMQLEAKEAYDALQERGQKELVMKRQDLLTQIEQEKEELISQIRGELDLEVAELRQQAKEEAKRLISEGQKHKTETDAQTKLKARELISQAQSEADQIVSTAKKTAQESVASAQSRAHEIETIAKQSAAKDHSELETELVEKKQRVEDELLAARENTVAQLAAQKKELAQQEEERHRLRALKIKKDLQKVLRVRISSYLKDKSQLEQVGELLDKSIDAIVLGKIENDLGDVNLLSDFDPSKLQQKAKQFWGIGVLAIVVLVCGFALMPSMKKAAVESSREIASESDKATLKKMEKARKANDLSKVFKPIQKKEFLESYTQRVVYTKDYVAIELNQEFREKWIFALQDFFVKELRLDENNLVPFIAQEANLIRKLDELKKTINGNFVDAGVKRMDEIEAKYVKELRKNLKKPSHYRKIKKFKKKFFEQYADSYRP